MRSQASKNDEKLSKGQRRALLLLLIGSPGPHGEVGEPVYGITRLQKLLFLLKKDYDVADLLQGGYDFEPWRFGPYSPQLYDDLEFLENLNLVEVSLFGAQSYPEQWEEELLDKQIFLSSFEEEEAEEYHGKAFRLTNRGRTKYDDVQSKLREDGVDVDSLMSAIREVKVAFGETPLSQLISYVYSSYPDYATKSELRHLM